jgi:eukaryotic-like serine/threonine-protein kinase
VGAESDSGRRRLWVRPLDSTDPQPIAGTEDASEPFWSPDGQHVAFFASGRLKRVPAAGGTVVTICDTGMPAGGTWSRDDVIVFAQLEGPLMRLAAGGGRAEPVTSRDRSLEETHHLYPTFLPNRNYVFYVNSRERGLYLGELGPTPARDRSTLTRPCQPARLPPQGSMHLANCSTFAIAR